jgi:ABC-type multidrug transport system fused ATPase/permease subunit
MEQKKIFSVKEIFRYFYLTYRNIHLLLQTRFLFGCLILIVGCSLNIVVQLSFKRILTLLPHSQGLLLSVTVTFPLITYALFWTINQLSNSLALLIIEPVLKKISQEITKEAFNKFLRASYSYFLTKEAKTITVYFEHILVSTQNILINIIIYIIPAIIEMTITFIIFLFFYSFSYLLPLIFLLGSFIIITVISIIKNKKIEALYHKAFTSFQGSLYQATQNIEIIKTYHSYDFELVQIEKSLEKLFSLSSERTSLTNKTQIYQIISAGVALLLITFVTLWQININQSTLEDFVLINNYFIQFSVPITFLGYVFFDVYKHLLILQKAFRLLTLPQEEQTETKKNNDTSEKNNDESQTSIITCKDISLIIKEKKILKPLSFTINKNEKIAIVGPSGSGKSTIFKIITKLLSPSQGKLFFKGKSIEELTREEMHKDIAFIPQKSYLFYGTIASNIHYNHAGERDDKKIITLLKKVNLYDRIKALPKGIETNIDDVEFSGGERQKITIARGLLKNASLFLCDEITSALDSQSEEEIVSFLYDSFFTDKTVISITHKPLIARNADRIILLDKGSISAIGSEEELLKNSKLYNELQAQWG